MANMKAPLTAGDFAELYDRFQTSLSRYDCGQYCAPLNGGEPVCCSTQNAIPIVQKGEWELLRSRTDLWHRFKPYDRNSREILASLSEDCLAIACKGARHCERENRTLACRAFPFSPYISRDGVFIGLSYYWIFADRCWVISNLQIVEQAFIDEFCTAYDTLFAKDPEEWTVFKEQSTNQRRIFSRKHKPFPVLMRDGTLKKEMPHGRGLRPAGFAEFRPHANFRFSPRPDRPPAKERPASSAEGRHAALTEDPPLRHIEETGGQGGFSGSIAAPEVSDGGVAQLVRAAES